MVRPLLTFFAMLRYGSVWGLKTHLEKKPGRVMRLVYQHYFMQRSSFVGLGCKLDGVPCFPHGVQGIFISNDAQIGRDVVIFQQVTIGSNTLADSRRKGAPVIGDCVYIGAGAKIIGNVCIGDHCRIGANAVVYEDMPPHSVAVCAPTRMIQKECLDNTYHTTINGTSYYFKDGKLHPQSASDKMLHENEAVSAI